MGIPLQMGRKLLILYVSSIALSTVQGVDVSYHALRMRASKEQHFLQLPCNCCLSAPAALKVFEWQGDNDKGNGGSLNFRIPRPSKKSVVKAETHIYIRYAACLGLANQLYSHITALALAARTGADVILAPATYRSSFKHAFDSADAQWTTASTSTILDVDSIIAFWRQRGINIHRVSHGTLR